MSDYAPDLYDQAIDLLKQCRDHKQLCVILRWDGDTLFVHCQNSEDVLPMCRKVVDAHDTPEGRTVN
ncbi:hypothetical protein [Lysobacter panacisoli]|uniref:Uncharacterized protein n=1 Tax=Lysobacter panacisoli TaxID=1255263 RepID=A0ABP9LCB2_9GAMM|nr:hypothetical protein [Lysobacter panacisoli]